MVLSFNSCTCMCTDMACISDTKPFTIKFANTDFNENDLSSIKLVRTDDSFNSIDTVSISQYLNTNDLSIDFFFISELYQTNFEIKDYNYLIINDLLNQTDSVWAMDYDIQLVSKVCNTCSGGLNCEDDYYEFKEYSNPEFKLNSSLQNTFEIFIEKK